MKFKEFLRGLLPVRIERSFTGANINRHTADWALSPVKTNEELKRSLSMLILRSRDLAKNNSYMKKYLSLRADNIVGSAGFGLQMRVKNSNGQPDNFANLDIENAWHRWGRKINKFCTACGTMGFVEFCKLVDRTLAVDGECFVQIIKGVNEFGLTLQIIDSLDIDVTYNVEAMTAAGNRIIMGIELDRYNRPIAYHTRENNSTTYYGGDRVRIPAAEIIHLFEKEYSGQARGIPHASAAIMDLNQLNGYQEAELIGARIGACQMGIWEKQINGSPVGKILPDNAAGTDNASYDMEPGAFMRAPSGYSLKQLTPTHPGGNFEPFCKAVLRRLAGSLGVSYNLFASDLETVNFSSLRSGALTERDTWTTKQNFFIENFVEQIFDEWLRMYLISGLTVLPFSKFNKFNQAEFRGRRWAWVDPKKDLEAAIIAIDNGLKDPQSVIADMGNDAEFVLDNLAIWKTMKAERGIVTIDNSSTPAAPPQNQVDETE
jgi:lambda family phage portal protein